MSILNTLKERQKVNEPELVKPVKSENNKWLLLIASIFSVIFSMSLLSQFISNSLFSLGVVIVIGGFLAILLIFNEKYKVNSITKIGEHWSEFKNVPVGYLLVAFLTTGISLSSAYGLYTLLVTVVNDNKESSVGFLKSQSINRQIDSLNNLSLYKVDSLVNQANPLLNQNIVRLEIELNNSNRYESDKKERLLGLIKEETNKLDLLKTQMKANFTLSIKELKEEKSKLDLTDQSNTTNFLLIGAFLCVLVLIVEVTIISIAFTNGIYNTKFKSELAEYDRKLEEDKQKKYKELMSNPITKKFLLYVEVLKYLYSFYKEDLTKKNIEAAFKLKTDKFTRNEAEEFRVLLLNLDILERYNNNKTGFNKSKDEALEILDTCFTKMLND
jgi:hypothetical protein